MMDRPEADPVLLDDDLRNLRIINRYFGGLSALRNAVLPLASQKSPEETVTILDLATGSGDQPLSLMRAFTKAGRSVHITAVDRNEHMLRSARAYAGETANIHFERQDLMALPYSDGAFDIVTCSLAIHHFSETDGVKILGEMNRLSRLGFVINDLSRSVSGAAAAWLYTRVTTRNPMTRYDSVLSVLRAYRKSEMRRLADAAGIQPVTIRYAPLFRLVTIKEK